MRHLPPNAKSHRSGWAERALASVCAESGRDWRTVSAGVLLRTVQLKCSAKIGSESDLQFGCGKVDKSTNLEGLRSAAEIDDVHRQRRWFEVFEQGRQTSRFNRVANLVGKQSDDAGPCYAGVENSFCRIDDQP